MQDSNHIQRRQQIKYIDAYVHVSRRIEGDARIEGDVELKGPGIEGDKGTPIQ
jgi:hypothetical protein